MFKSLFSVVALTVLVLTGCGAVNADAQAPIELRRDSVRLTPQDGAAQVQLTLHNATARTKAVVLHLTLGLFDGIHLGDIRETVQARPGDTPVDLRIHALPPPDRMAEGVLRYNLQYDNNVHGGGFNVLSLLPTLSSRLVTTHSLLAGGESELRVRSTSSSGEEPAAGATVTAFLEQDDRRIPIYTGTTDANGEAAMRFQTPHDAHGRFALQIDIEHPEYGQDRIEQSINVIRPNRTLLTTDKPRYQPGQVIHMRTLTLNRATRQPIQEAELVFEVMDAKGNKVFKETATTGDYGVSSTDFSLATEVNEGSYAVRALLDDVVVEKTVTVEKYVLPKFDIEVTTDRDFYTPGETLKATVQSDYFFGKPVAGGRVRVTASKFEIAYESFAELEGILDETGHWSFEVPLPDFFAGTPIEQGQASIHLEVTVIDTADQREDKAIMKPVAASALQIAAIPEGGKLQPGMTNIVYVLVTNPDGTPVSDAKVTLSSKLTHDSTERRTDAVGITSFPISLIVHFATSITVSVEAREAQGREAKQDFKLAVQSGDHGLLIRPDKALYRVGDTLHAEIFTTRPEGRVYLDLVREGQTVLTHTATIDQGKATFSVDLDASLAGSVLLHAYTFSPTESLIRATRPIYVDPANELRIDATLDAETYRPGESAEIAFAVTDPEGAPTPAAIGISIVDESVFALQEMRPGLERVYFMLENAIMKPRYQIHGYGLDELIVRPAWNDAQQRAAQVLLASPPEPRPINLTHTGAARIEQAKRAIRARMHDDTKRIEAALEKLYRDEESFGDTSTLLRRLLQKRYLYDFEVTDPWGNRYEVDFSNVNEFGGQFVLRTAGPDGIFDSNDDYSDLDAVGRGNMRNDFIDMRTVGSARMLVEAQPEPAMRVAPAALPPGSSDSASGQAPRIREFFPETLLFEPALITDNDGKATLAIDMADSITTWRMTTMASSTAGALGSMDTPIRVFQDFFVDLDLPVSLTQNDEISIPVAIYNYLDTAQDIRLQFEAADWFELRGDREVTITVEADEVTVRYFPITVKKLGTHPFTVFAHGHRLSDAIRREIEVRPDGARQEQSISDRIGGNITQTVAIPSNAIDDASKILVRLYPGVFSQVVDGLESMLQMPYGCFEQTSSVSYPNVLIVRYMEETKQINPELRMKAEGFINAGYQRLLSYEVNGGGFSWFGNAPANKVLTAWGVKQFHDMAQVHEVDPAVKQRTMDWLLQQQAADGSWAPDESYLHQDTWGNVQSSALLVTAYIAEALLHGEHTGNGIEKAMDYIQANWEDSKDPYILALVANAQARWRKNDPFTDKVLDTLHNLRIEEGDTVHWKSNQDTVTFSRGDARHIETTALALLAFLEAGRYSETVNKALTYLVQKKSSGGHWGSTQATILSLQAMLKALGGQTEQVDARIAVRINGERVSTIEVTPENSDVMRLIDLGAHTIKGENIVGLDFEGEGSMLYQIVGRHYAPWAARPVGQEPITIAVAYDKTQLAVDDVATASVKVSNNRPQAANMLIVDLGIPPGFDVMTEDLTKLVDDGVVEKFETTGRQIILYFEKIDPNATIAFHYKLRARFPLRAQTPESRAYEYYNPEVEAFSQPVAMVVE